MRRWNTTQFRYCSNVESESNAAGEEYIHSNAHKRVPARMNGVGRKKKFRKPRDFPRRAHKRMKLNRFKLSVGEWKPGSWRKPIFSSFVIENLMSEAADGVTPMLSSFFFFFFFFLFKIWRKPTEKQNWLEYANRSEDMKTLFRNTQVSCNRITAI